MADFHKMYMVLFNSITDALKLMDDNDFSTATEVLKDAQIKTEDMYIDENTPEG